MGSAFQCDPPALTVGCCWSEQFPAGTRRSLDLYPSVDPFLLPAEWFRLEYPLSSDCCRNWSPAALALWCLMKSCKPA